ncbi:hypothetical protein [Rhodococcus opacus]|uniref:hypothetical protein n=1 Tax=Rhodococcus opacus TaxID=37919 RepID=UPI0024758044|nr:hypothetical protein [Rhodococcus opacus]MDH6293135.1 hypothetical protein [Rhodococcus opacus]
MATILVWNCGEDHLAHAKQEASHLESLRSADCEVLVAPRSVEWNNLAAFAGAVKPTIFHFIGHGEDNGQLVVREGGNRVTRPAADVIRVVRAASASLDGVYLSGCYTAKPGPELLKDLPPAAGWAIGTVSEVDDELAAQFSEKFYDHLIGSAASPQKAYDVANAYAVADWGNEVPHAAWFVLSPLPAVDQMAQTIWTGLRGIFNRAAFTVSMKNEMSLQDLDDALQDVSHALGTGQVLSRRDRTVIPPASFPPEWLQEPTVQSFVTSALRGVNDTRKALADLREGNEGVDCIIGNAINFNPAVAQDEWMKRINRVDRARNNILRAINALLERNNIPPFSLIPDSYGPAEIKRISARK